jgi:phenylpyruvate tautomerase PptA (4-oxalocrotonate tautomerase family)
MPFINVNTTQKLQDDAREAIKKRLGELISIVPGKSESVLMIKFDDSSCMYYSGTAKAKAAYVDIRIHGSATQEQKKQLIENVFELFREQLGIESKDVFITISEFENWGFEGTMV